MTATVRLWALVAAVAAIAVVLAACGTEPEEVAEPEPVETTEPPVDDTVEADDEAETPEPEPEPAVAADGEDFCDNLGAVLAQWDDFGTAMFTAAGDLAPAAAAFVAEAPGLLDAAQAAAPDDIAQDFEVMAGVLAGLVDHLGGVDLDNEEAVADSALEFFEGVDESDDAAFDAVETYAANACGDGEAATDAPDADSLADPCTFVDPQLVAGAAGIDASLEAGQPTSTFEVPGFASRSCAFDASDGSVTVTVETMGLSSVDGARSMYADNAEEVIEGVDLGDLPASTLITESFGLRAIYVFEAPVPFGIHVFPGEVEPAALVTAAQAVLAEVDG